MKVTYFYRPKMDGVFSIETVFDIVKRELSNNISITDFVCTHRWRRFYSFFQSRKYQGDVNHITGDIHPIALFLNSKKTILTIHDVGRYERGLKGLKKKIYKILLIILPVKKVAKVTTVSEFTKKKILKLTNIPESKIHVIYNPLPSDFGYSPKIFNKQNTVVLQIGSGQNKNLHRLIQAIIGTSYQLLLIRQPDAEIESQLIKYNIKYEWYNDLDRDAVYECYKKSDILFFASEYEGFGIPILEANIVGRPVITSNIASMPEVAQDAAILVDPYNVDEIRDALDLIREDDKFRDLLIEKGRKNIERFTASNIAAQYLNLYNIIYEQSER